MELEDDCGYFADSGVVGFEEGVFHLMPGGAEPARVDLGEFQEASLDIVLI